MSFVDKVASGAALMLIQEFIPGHAEDCNEKCAEYFRWILMSGCGGAAMIGLLTMVILAPLKIGER